MTHHTYRVIWHFDLEAESPEEAAQAVLLEALALGSKPVGSEDRPILEVRQFVDTDVGDKVYDVDTLNWTKVRNSYKEHEEMIVKVRLKEAQAR